MSDYFVFRQWQQDYRRPFSRAPQCQRMLSLTTQGVGEDFQTSGSSRKKIAMTDKMSTKIKLCEWFGHRDESTGPERGDFTSEGFVCTRCGHTHSENEWATPSPAPKIRKVGFILLAVLGMGSACYLPTVIEDAQTYRAVIAEQHACCGFVSESWIERPVTYVMVDEWTKPVWSENATKTERWLTSEGKVSGETRFWRVLQRERVTNVQR